MSYPPNTSASRNCPKCATQSKGLVQPLAQGDCREVRVSSSVPAQYGRLAEGLWQVAQSKRNKTVRAVGVLRRESSKCVQTGEPIQNHPSRARQTVHAKILSASFFTAALRQFPGKLRERCCPRRFCVSRRRSWGPSAAFATRPRGQGAVTAAECSRSDSSILRHPKRPKPARDFR